MVSALIKKYDHSQKSILYLSFKDFSTSCTLREHFTWLHTQTVTYLSSLRVDKDVPYNASSQDSTLFQVRLPSKLDSDQTHFVRLTLFHDSNNWKDTISKNLQILFQAWLMKICAAFISLLNHFQLNKPLKIYSVSLELLLVWTPNSKPEVLETNQTLFQQTHTIKNSYQTLLNWFQVPNDAIFQFTWRIYYVWTLGPVRLLLLMMTILNLSHSHPTHTPNEEQQCLPSFQ